MIYRYSINITHRLSKNQYNRTIINHITASEEFYSQREHTDRQTNRRRRWSTYIIKKIYLFHHKRDYLFARRTYTYTHYIHTNTQYRAASPSPPVDNIHTHNTYAQTHKHASAFSTSALFERGKPISEGGKLSTNQKAAFFYVLLLS